MDKKCKHPACEKAPHAIGYCNTHYKPAIERGLIGARRPCVHEGCAKFAVGRDSLCIMHHRLTTASWKAKEKRRRESPKRKAKRKEYDQRYNSGSKRLACLARYQHRRYIQEKLATPTWLTEDQKWIIDQFYEATQPGFAVDHIIPILGENVCGLHVPWNLQILTEEENSKKGNRLVEAIPRTA